MKRLIFGFATLLALAPVRADDFPMFGGRPDRNMVSAEKGLPVEFSETKGVKWVAALGDMTYGNPVVAGGRVFIGTNSGSKTKEADKGVLLCLSSADGSLLWKAVYDKLEAGEAEDATGIGICSTPSVAGERVYYVSNRNELVCADVLGFGDQENDGPFTGEKRTGDKDVDVVWTLDMRNTLGAIPFQGVASSPLVVGDLVFVVTGHGVDYKTHKLKDEKVPSFIAVDKATGKLVWQDASPGSRIIDGQWSSPAYGVVDGVPQVAFGGGDGCLYAFEPATGKPLWKFNTNVQEELDADGKPKTHNHLVATPVFVGHRVVIASGGNPEGEQPGCIRAIDARKRGDITKEGELWRIGGDEFKCTISTVAVHEGLVYAAELPGWLNCFDLESGKRYWRHDLLSTVWGSPLVADGKVYIRTADGDVVVLALGREKKVLAKNPVKDLHDGTPVAAEGALFLAGWSKLYRIEAGK